MLIRRIRLFFAPVRLRRRALVLAGSLIPSRLLRRLVRLGSDPHAVAAGFASGAALSCTPLFGLHFLLSFALAWAVRGHILAAALGTAVGNPITFPFLVSGAYGVGTLLFGVPDHLEEAGMAVILRDAFLVTLVGSLPIATLAYAGTYLLLKPALIRLRGRGG
ncbi:hypothetical protein IQ03_01020 [Gemmobacter caeni]|uniref:DUF2062 domain-containing protein n=1 Tax=Gemmobacter caeni TaxID=589035 RepID=A0A2T6B817_9RHOB|nr:DUF2062 domain-containing protein [Gemmobacter caeni]PTX52230.1 hypothetical protein C8N34_1028 [Gemmobacter caeni]TWJ02603.1 hypothetical protein IQ03_01020 [Gemmobacter caeni]